MTQSEVEASAWPLRRSRSRGHPGDLAAPSFRTRRLFVQSRPAKT